LSATIDKDTPACAGDSDAYRPWAVFVSAVAPAQPCSKLSSENVLSPYAHFSHGYNSSESYVLRLNGIAAKKLCLIISQPLGDEVLDTVVVQPAIYPPMLCKSFTYQEDAQAWLARFPDLWTQLDTDHDGIACNGLPHRLAAVPGPPATRPSTPAVRPSAPWLSQTTARDPAKLSLVRGFGHRYRSGRAKVMSCRRLSRARVRCLVTWRYAARRYSGSVWVTKCASGRIATAIASIGADETRPLSTSSARSRCRQPCRQRALWRARRASPGMDVPGAGGIDQTTAADLRTRT
jgi:hypothetical protein